ncbi:MAG: VWA domain-containing protein [Planctomycetes bacterium]|nr:VWA domain-containing protein [Planctomycetota bacterium]
MKPTQTMFSCALAATLLLPSLGAQSGPNQGRHIRLPSPPHVRYSPVRVESTIVNATVRDGVATTRVKFRLRNDSGGDAEKILLVPIPKGASADGLELWIGGKPEKGEVLDKNKARGIYQSIVSSRRDPALLEYVDQGTLQLRVFPVPPKGTQDVEVRYRMLLPFDGGMRRWEFPCRALESGRFSISLDIESAKAIKNVWTPIEGFDVARKGDHGARASYECAQRPSRDPVVFYGLSQRDFGLDLLTYRDGQGEGYFLALVAPKRDWQGEKELRKSIHFVLDTSGSMQGQKIEQARGALRFFLQSLRPTDRFNVVPFSTEARPFYSAPVIADETHVKDALEQTKALEARGGTNIHEALTQALSAENDSECVPIVVFLTDGLPTVGMTDEKDLLSACRQANGAGARVFVFGVGNDVNTRFLDTVADETRGARDYVQPGEDLEVKVSGLFEKLAHPVMTDLALVADDVKLDRMVPNKLPDLFRGSHLVVAGRYRGCGSIALRLRGKVGGESKEFVYDATFPECATDNDFVATLWAQRRIGQLVDQLRLHGQSPELVAEVKRLGREHGIVTPWTSQLVVEESERLARFAASGDDNTVYTRHGFRRRADGGAPVPPGAGGGRTGGVSRKPGPAGPSTPGPQGGPPAGGRGEAGAPADDARDYAELEELGKDRAEGKKAVRTSLRSLSLVVREKLRDDESRRALSAKRIDSRVFLQVEGVWVDSKLDEKLAKDVREIEAFTDAYFELLAAHPELAKAFAFSTSIVVVVDGKAIQITPPKPADPGKDDGKSKTDDNPVKRASGD